MELKVSEITLPQALEFNYSELKAELTERVKQYETAVYTEDMIKEAKADRSKLNKVKKSLNDERIRLEREFMAPFQDFKSKVTELCGIIDKAVGCVDLQIKEFEEKKRLEKEEQIDVLFNDIFAEHPWLKASDIWNPKWLNVSYSLKQITEDLMQARDDINNSLAVLGRLQEYSFEAIACFRDTLDLGAALKYADDLREIAKEKAKVQAESTEIATETAEIEGFMPKPITLPTEEENLGNKATGLSTIEFRVTGTFDQLMNLSEFMKNNNIHFERI